MKDNVRKSLLCRMLGHHWSCWMLKADMQWYIRRCVHCHEWEQHSVWECANEGHGHA